MLPLGQSAPVITGIEHTTSATTTESSVAPLEYRFTTTNKGAASNHTAVFDGRGSDVAMRLVMLDAGNSSGLLLNGVPTYVSNLWADFTKATDAKAIVCIKY